FSLFLFSSPQPSPAGEGAFFLNLMAVTPERGNDHQVFPSCSSCLRGEMLLYRLSSGMLSGLAGTPIYRESRYG
ncbi:MAG: hypothetical protein QX203_06540, partial [Methylococcaceae bacterium]